MKLLLTIFIITTLGACVSKMGANITNQPTLKDYSLGEKWVWKFKGVTDKGVVRADGLDSRQVINDNGMLSIKSSKASVSIADLINGR